jgi:hypothetical protein
MSVLGWLKARRRREEPTALAAWRAQWTAAIEAQDAGQVEPLRAALAGLATAPDDLEIEEEMLEGLTALVDLTASLRDGQLPHVVTGHRVVGTDACAFSAPASLPDDPAQPAGRVMLTDRRAIFAGGGQSVTAAWHRVGSVVRVDRDLLLVLGGTGTVHRFRFNSYADALCGAAIARHLTPRRNLGSRGL